MKRNKKNNTELEKIAGIVKSHIKLSIDYLINHPNTMDREQNDCINRFIDFLEILQKNVEDLVEIILNL